MNTPLHSPLAPRMCLALLGLVLVGACQDGGGGQQNETDGNGTDGSATEGGDGGTADGGGETEGADGSDGSDDGEPTTGGDDGPNTGEAGTAVEQLVAAHCGWMFGCCDRGELDWYVGPFTSDADNCTERMMAQLEYGMSLPPTPGVGAGPSERLVELVFGLSENRIEIDSDAVSACVAHLQEGQCTRLVTEEFCVPGPTDVMQGPCDPRVLFEGKQGVGQPCAHDYECGVDSRCDLREEHGLCVAVAGDGDFCFDDDDCDDGLFCNSDSGTCTGRLDEGQACNDEGECRPGLICDGQSSTCENPCVPDRSYCNADYDCPEGWFCEDESGSCQRRETLSVGDICTESAACQSGYCGYVEGDERCLERPGLGDACEDIYACEESQCRLDGEQYRCMPLAGTGEACGGEEGIDCEPGNYCDDATERCVRRLNAGEACEGNDSYECLSASGCEERWDRDMCAPAHSVSGGAVCDGA